MYNPPSRFRLLFLTCFLLNALLSDGQVLTGKVLDAEKKEPVPFSTVFFGGTMKGTISGVDGSFELSGFQPGRYDIVVSCVGYQDLIIPMTFEDGERKEMDFELKVDLIELPDFYLNPDTSTRRYDLLTFMDLFLGTTPNRSQVKVLNPDDVFLYFDPGLNVLYAHASKPIEIENNALGYRVSFRMKQFEMNFRSEQFLLFGIPSFTEMQPENKSQLKRWKKERLRAYNGSKIQFFRALKSDSLKEQEFEADFLYRIPNKERPADSLIQNRIRKYVGLFRKEQQEKGLKNARVSFGGGDVNVSSGSSTYLDSLNYWRRVRELPAYQDSLGASVSRSSDLMKDDILFHTGFLRIQYLGEREDPIYARLAGREKTDTKQRSVLLLMDSLRIYANGHFENVRNVRTEGYWSWSSPLSELLPLDYRPE